MPMPCLLVLLACLLASVPVRFASAAVNAASQVVAPVSAATSSPVLLASASPKTPAPDSVAGSDAAPAANVGHLSDGGDQPATEGGKALYAEALRVLSQVRNTRYTSSYVVDEDTGRFELNCSGFLSLLLYEVNPSALATVDRSGKHYRPRAEDFHRSILRAGPKGDGTGWLQVERVSDLRPGDVVAWLRPAERSASSATGHVMVALASPRLNPARPGEVLLPVADCTLSPHGDLAAMHEVGSPRSEAARVARQVGEPAAESVAGQAMEQTLAPVPGTVLGRQSMVQPQQADVPLAIAPGLERGSAAWLDALPRDVREPGIGGVGSGVIGLATDDTGHPVAYWWRGGVSRHRLVTSIMLGRLE